MKNSELKGLVAVSGGIGSGKSVVCKILTVKGFRVYDCDSRAKALMEGDRAIIDRICNEITPDAVDRLGSLNRRAVASVVFNNPDKLQRLNEIVHGAVRSDLLRWYNKHHSEGKPLFVETAILYQSNLDAMVEKVWEVTAPEELRIQRAMRRDGADFQAVKARVESQRIDIASPHCAVMTIENDEVTPMLPRINALLEDLQ